MYRKKASDSANVMLGIVKAHPLSTCNIITRKCPSKGILIDNNYILVYNIIENDIVWTFVLGDYSKVESGGIVEHHFENHQQMVISMYLPHIIII